VKRSLGLRISPLREGDIALYELRQRLGANPACLPRKKPRQVASSDSNTNMRSKAELSAEWAARLALNTTSTIRC